MALMVRRKLAMAVGLTTVIVASLAEAIGQIGFIGGALVFALPSEAKLHHLFWPVMGGLAIAIALAVLFLVVQLKHPFLVLWKAAARLDMPALASPEMKTAAAEADGLLIDFYRNHRVRLLGSCACYLVAWALGPLEIFILLRLLHQPATWTVALMVEAVGLLIERATFLVPAKLVSQEGGKALILSMLGYPAKVGFAVGFLRRIKELVWVLFGLTGLAIHRMVTGRAGSSDATVERRRVADQIAVRAAAPARSTASSRSGGLAHTSGAEKI
jgi:hypothetical protein